MKKITINFEYCYTANDDVLLDVQSHYTSAKTDHIIITKKRIIIEAERGNKHTASNMLTNTNSTLYAQLLKAIVYVYMTGGKAFNLGEVFVDVNGEIKRYLAGEIINPCLSDLDNRFIVDRDQCRHIFDDIESNINLLIAYICYIRGVQEHDFDWLWKAFNSIYSIISTKDKEFDKLCDVKSFVVTNWPSMVRTNMYMDNENEQMLRKLRIREFVLNDYENLSKTKAYADMVKSFTDYRMAALFDEIMPYRRDNLISEGLYHDVDNHIQCQMGAGIKNNSDLARFYILKYSYFLRNKYFHAEKGAPVFVLKKNNEIDELDKICEILGLFLADLFDCYHMYCR